VNKCLNINVSVGIKIAQIMTCIKYHILVEINAEGKKNAIMIVYYPAILDLVLLVKFKLMMFFAFAEKTHFLYPVVKELMLLILYH
tara:strand:+ start:229 stop:486 length:258 start_codon:yes stop_codon:yes gene_type:complete